MAVRLGPNVAGRLDGPRVVRRRLVTRRIGRGGFIPATQAARRAPRTMLSIPLWMIRGYQTANASDLAAAIAYHALVALIPIFLLLVTVGGLVLQVDRLLINFIHALLWALPQDQAREALDATLSARRHSGWFAALSALGFAWVGSGFVSSLARCMNRVYGVPNRRFVHQRPRDFMVIILFSALFLLTSLAATIPTLFVGRDLNVLFQRWAIAAGGVQILSYGLALLAAFGLFYLLYRVVPNAGQRWRDVWPGTLTAAVLFVALLQAFPLYLRLVGGVNRYGQFFGFIPLIVAWFYLLAHILLFGTYVNATFQSHCRKRRGIAGHSLPGCERDATATGDKGGENGLADPTANAPRV